ncbi:MAG: alpha/beta hydrolase [Bdellovibrionales bacterium]
MIYCSEFDYEVIAPDYWSGPENGKLIIVLHGRGDSLKPFREFNEELPLPGFTYLLLNAPRKYDGGYTWYPFPPNQGAEVQRNRLKIFRLLEELKMQGWDLKNVFFLGFSQGSLMSIDVGMRYPEPLGGIIGISGYIYHFDNWLEEVSEAAYETPFLITHGIQDVDLPIEDTRKDVWKLMFEACLPIDWREYNKEHDIDDEIECPEIAEWVFSQLERKRNPRKSISYRRKKSNEIGLSL